MELSDLLSETGRTNPYRFYADLHSTGAGATRVGAAREGYAVAVFGHDAVNQLLRDSRFRQLDADYLDANRPRWREHPAMQTLRNSIFFADGAEHFRVRRLISTLFTARRVAAMEPAIGKLIHDRIDRLDRLGGGGEPVDFMAEFAYDVPSSIIGDLLGVPEEDREWFKPRVLAISAIFELDGSTRTNMVAADTAAEELTAFFADLVERRRAEPRDDIVTDLGRIQGELPDQFSPQELVANLITLFNAGFVTTTHMFGNGLTMLLDRPDLREELITAPAQAGGFVEEILRLEPPAHFVIRYSTVDGEIAGCPVARGETILVMLGAANRDPRRFDQPDLLDPHRTDGEAANAILTFGVGGHYCLGAAMTRLEGVIAFPAIFERFPEIALVEQPPPPRQLMFRGHDVLPVRLR